MRMSLNDSTAPIASISESDTPPFFANPIYPASTQLDIEYERPNSILSSGVRPVQRFECEQERRKEELLHSSARIAMLRSLKQRQSVEILRTEIHSSFDAEFLLVQTVSLRKFILKQPHKGSTMELLTDSLSLKEELFVESDETL